MRALRECRECRASFEGEGWQKLCWACWRKGAGRQSRRAEGVTIIRREPLIAERTIRAAIQLCHPDRHAGREELATRTTAELLDALGAVREISRPQTGVRS